MKIIIYLISLVMWSYQCTSAEVKAFALAHKFAFSNYEIKEMLNEYGVYAQMTPEMKEKVNQALEKPSVFYFDFSKDKFQISVNSGGEKFNVSVKNNSMDVSSPRVKASIQKGETFESIYTKLNKTKVSFYLKNLIVPSAYGQDYSNPTNLLDPMNLNSPLNPIYQNNDNSGGGGGVSAASGGALLGGMTSGAVVAGVGVAAIGEVALSLGSILLIMAAIVTACAAIGFLIGDATTGFSSTKAIKNKLLSFKEKMLLQRAVSVCNNQLSTFKDIPRSEIEKIKSQIKGETNHDIKNQLSSCLESLESKKASVNQDKKSSVKRIEPENNSHRPAQGISR